MNYQNYLIFHIVYYHSICSCAVQGPSIADRLTSLARRQIGHSCLDHSRISERRQCAVFCGANEEWQIEKILTFFDSIGEGYCYPRHNNFCVNNIIYTIYIVFIHKVINILCNINSINRLWVTNGGGIQTNILKYIFSMFIYLIIPIFKRDYCVSPFRLQSNRTML